MKIFYHASDYVSHARAGADNRAALLLHGHEIVDDPIQAEVAVLHDEPINYVLLMQRLRGLDIPIVGYCVVETDPMPPVYAQGLGLADEVWTCSEFSRELLAREVGTVHVIPHVVQRTRFGKNDLDRVRSMVGKAGPFTFYTVADSCNPRKNLPALLRAFAAFGGNPRYRLVVKQYRKALDLSGLPGVVSIEERLTDAEMAALHATCDCYVSPHRAEAWGLGLSEAMAFGNTVVATGYSGNLEFMDTENALLVDYSMETVSQEDLGRCPPFFTSEMRWAAVSESDLHMKMRTAASNDTSIGRVASGITREYSSAKIGELMSSRLLELVHEFRD